MSDKHQQLVDLLYHLETVVADAIYETAAAAVNPSEAYRRALLRGFSHGVDKLMALRPLEAAPLPPKASDELVALMASHGETLQ